MDQNQTESSVQLLKNRFDLHNAPEVQAAAQRTEKRTGEKVSRDPFNRIQHYLDRFEDILSREDPQERERGIRAVKKMLYGQSLVEYDEIPGNYWDLQKHIVRKEGKLDILKEPFWTQWQKDHTNEIKINQAKSLDDWIDYLASSETNYPIAMKYWVLRSVLKMSEYDLEAMVFPQRSKGTTKRFPELNQEALEIVLDAMRKKYQANSEELIPPNDPPLELLLQTENFSKLYAYALEKVTPPTQIDLTNIQGNWVTYDQHSDYLQLVSDIYGKRTSWCTVGEATAAKKLDTGDIYIYYSHDQQGNETIPRIAIRMEGNKIAEIRGIAAKQNIDRYILPKLEEKLKDMDLTAEVQKKLADVKQLIHIDEKMSKGEDLALDELKFLYEIDTPLDYFGYQPDPIIAQLREKRDYEADLLTLFSCETEQIARSTESIGPHTKVYNGPLEPEVFTRCQQYHVEYIFTAFPDGRIKKQRIPMEKPMHLVIEELKNSKVHLSSDATRYLQKHQTASQFTDSIEIVRMHIAELGFLTNPTVQQVIDRAKELGLTPCPKGTEPYLRLAYTDQPVGDWLWVLNDAQDQDGRLELMMLGHDSQALQLDTQKLFATDTVYPMFEFAFAFPE